jgi:hypothetical protein
MIRYLCGTYVARKARRGSFGRRCAVVADTVTWGFWLERAKGIEPS